MNTEKQMWDKIKNEYLEKIEESLADVEHQRAKEILKDVESHLEQKFACLGDNQQTWENMQQIVTDMGPTEDYAELLGAGQTIPKAGQGPKMLLLLCSIVAIVSVVAGFLAAKATLPPAAYLVEFRPIAPFSPQTAKELLDAFNKNHPQGVQTHHYRTSVEDNSLVGYICTDTRIGAEALTEMLKKSDRLEFIGVKILNRNKFEKYQVSMGQPSLAVSPPRVIGSSPVAFANDISTDLKEISVTFDQPMANFSWSWVGGGETFPKMTGQPKYDKERRICTLPCELEPSRVYRVGINSPQYKNFQTEDEVAAVPYVILFATKGKDGNTTEISQDYIEEAKGINSSTNK